MRVALNEIGFSSPQFGGVLKIRWNGEGLFLKKGNVTKDVGVRGKDNNNE